MTEETKRLVNSEDIKTIYQANPFGSSSGLLDLIPSLEEVKQDPSKIEEIDLESEEIGQAAENSFQEANDLGYDMKEIMDWAYKTIVPSSMAALTLFGPECFAAMWISAFRCGFLLGRGYEEDGH